jgi:ABC-type Fe3+-hydroxamate transport system substrate-binding protein
VPWLRTTDALGREVRLDAPPRRIVSLVPSLTELLADLGLGEAVVGLTRFCVRPPGWKASRTVVGGTKNVRADRVAALRPDLVLANREENVREQVEALAAVAPVYVTDVPTVDASLDMIRAVGALTDRADAARALAQETAAAFAGLDEAPPLRAAYLIWRDPWMTVGADTLIHDVMRRGGLVNVFGHTTRYPAVSGADLAAARPGVLLLSSEPFPFRDAHLDEARTLVPGARAALVDGEAFSWFGSRLRHTPSVLRSLRATLAG